MEATSDLRRLVDADRPFFTTREDLDVIQSLSSVSFARGDLSIGRYRRDRPGLGITTPNPLVPMVIFTFVFGRLAKFPTGGIPYPIFALAGLLPWQLFSTAFSESSSSVVANTQLVSNRIAGVGRSRCLEPVVVGRRFAFEKIVQLCAICNRRLTERFNRVLELVPD